MEGVWPGCVLCHTTEGFRRAKGLGGWKLGCSGVPEPALAACRSPFARSPVHPTHDSSPVVCKDLGTCLYRYMHALRGRYSLPKYGVELGWARGHEDWSRAMHTNSHRRHCRVHACSSIVGKRPGLPRISRDPSPRASVLLAARLDAAE